MSINDSTDYITDFISNIQIVLNNYKDYIGVHTVATNDDLYIPRYPYITIEADSWTEEWKEIPRRKTLIANFSISYFCADINDKSVREKTRTGMSKICNVIRENWSLNNFCPQLGAHITSSVPYVMMKGESIVAGGVITLQCKKVITVTLV